MEIYTIGFTQSTAEHFFGRLRDARIERLLDIRLSNESQLAGFAKHSDLPYFLSELCEAKYEHDIMLAPTQRMLSSYRNKEIDWPEYARAFNRLMRGRRIETKLSQASFRKTTALLCSEATADKCHRRLVAEYLERRWKGVTVTHL